MSSAAHTNGNTDTKINLMLRRLKMALDAQPDEDSVVLAAGMALGGDEDDPAEARLMDICDVVGAAAISIRKTMLAAFPKHATGSWKDEGYDHHIDRAVRHLTNLLNGDSSEPHLPHALCRLTMALRCCQIDARHIEPLPLVCIGQGTSEVRVMEGDL